MHSVDHNPLLLLGEIRRLECELADRREELATSSANEGSIEPLLALEVGCADATFLIPVESIREVGNMVWIEPLPDAASWILGTFDYGPNSVPVLDLDRRLGGQGLGVDPAFFLVIMDHPSWLGVVVDRLGAVHSLGATALAAGGVEAPHANFVLASLRLQDQPARLLASRSLVRGSQQTLEESPDV